MKTGAKRFAFESDPASGSGPQGKRVMDAPSFDVHRVESSHQHLMAGPPLDRERAESAHQHVRALNSQFASWVQVQLQDHPDELWEDGVSDYLSHASQIMEKFKDVVEWLREKSEKQRSMSLAGSMINQKKLADVTENNVELRQSKLNNGFSNQPATISTSTLKNSSIQSTGQFSFSQPPKFAASVSNQATVPPDITNLDRKQVLPPSFSTSHSSGLQSSGFFSFIQKPAFSGVQSDFVPKAEANGDADEEDDTEKPSSPSLEKAKEKGIIVVHETKCKLYVKTDNPAEKVWKDMGTGHLSIKCKEGAQKATKASRPTIVIRNDVGKILLNALIYHGIKMNIQKNTIASIFHTTVGGHGAGADTQDVAARMFLLKLKNEEETTKLATAIKDYAPSDNELA